MSGVVKTLSQTTKKGGFESMNKNLKKVISSVVALALSLGSLSAFAASYSDVADTASYATAVNELSALGIVNGYEDGTFQPDAKVTRAEVTKMIVASLAQTRAADAAKGATSFSDVASDHWASGYINVGSSTSGFINGMGDGTFAPEANVTYAQLVKMLVVSLGYGGMALQEGGYPTGYITVGDRIGVTKEVVANANDELTRGQVAMLINNSVNLPLLVTTVWSAANPEYEIKDGTGKYFQSLLTEYHDTYKVEGKIVNTSRSNSGLDPDEAEFEIAVADRFDDNMTFARNDGYTSDERTFTVKVADDIDANAELFAYSTALIYKNSDDEYELISLNSTSKSKTVELPIGAFDEENKDYNDYGSTDEDQAANAIYNGEEALKFYATDEKTGKVTDYKIASSTRSKNKTTNDVQLRVNGVEVSWTLSNIKKYIVNNEAGKVVLVDAPQESKATTDGYYDYILVDYYDSAIVDEVQSNGTVYFDSRYTGTGSSKMPSKIKFDQDKVEDGDLTYTITLDGKEIDYTDLQQDDVLAIAYDVTTGIEDSAFYEVIVTRGTVEGKISSEDEDDKTYEVSGTTYKFDKDLYSDGYPSSVASKNGGTMVGINATMYVDAFGRVVKLEESSSSKKYAILDNVWQKSGDTLWYARLVLPDGTTKEYEIKDDDADDIADLKDIVFVGGDSDNAKNVVYDRVVTYKVNTSDKINSIAQVTNYVSDTDEYVAKSNKVGSVKLNDSTSILDAEDYLTSGKVSDLETISSLIDDTTYTAYGYDKLSDNTYSFVIITSGIGGYTDDTQIAIFKKYYTDTNSDGDAADAIKVLYNGAETNLIADDLDSGKTVKSLGLSKGDVIVFKLKSDNEIKDIDIIAKASALEIKSSYSFTHSKLSPSVLNEIAQWEGTTNGGSYDTDIDLWFGPIVDKDSSSITLDRTNTVTTDNTWENGTRKSDKELSLSSDTKVYVYDYSESGDKQLYVGTIGDIVKSPIASAYKDDTTDAVLWDLIQSDSDVSESINYAFVKADKDDALEVYVILADD
jgi:hypothetical protein